MRWRSGTPKGARSSARCRRASSPSTPPSILGIPIPALYVLVLAVVLWIVSERLPLGRHVYAIGANEKAAALNGIPVRHYVIGVFVASALIAGFAGCVLAAKLRIGQANVGLDYLLPALVGAFLGSTTIKPGRVNVWGTMFGVADPRGRHLRDPAARRRLLRRAAVQRHDAGHRHRARRLRAAPPGDRDAEARAERSGLRESAAAGRAGWRGASGRRRCRRPSFEPGEPA